MLGLGVIGAAFLALGLLASIALHELGHFLPARKFGARVPEFMVGFGPRLVSRRVGGTVVGLRLLPLGGYVRILGMFPPGGPGGGKLAAEARARSAEEVAEADARPFWSLAPWRRIVVMTGGPAANLAIWLCLSCVVLLGLGLPGVSPAVSEIQECMRQSSSACAEPSPASRAGLRAGDEIMSVNGTEVSSGEQALSAIRSLEPDVPAQVVVRRDGAPVPLSVVPAASPAGTGAAYVGVALTPALVRPPVVEVPGMLAGQVAGLASAVALFPVRVVDTLAGTLAGEPRDEDGPVGVVGVGRLGGEVAAATQLPWEFRLVFLLSILAGLNLALFAFNMLPLLPLDGGHVASALFESMRLRYARLRGLPPPGPVDLARLLPVSYGVAMVVITMSLALLYVDVVNPIQLFD